MRSILIDPTVILSGDEQHIAAAVVLACQVGRHIGYIRDALEDTAPVRNFKAIRHASFPDESCCYVNADTVATPASIYFCLFGYPAPLMGRGLMRSIDRTGEDADVRASVADVRDNLCIGCGPVEWTARDGLRVHDQHVLLHWSAHKEALTEVDALLDCLA